MRKRKGFTLIEAIVTIAIIGILSISLFNIFSSGLNNIVRAGNRTKAIEGAKIDLYDNPDVLEETINVVIQLDSGDLDINVSGSSIKGQGIINKDKRNEVMVEIEVFIPNN